MTVSNIKLAKKLFIFILIAICCLVPIYTAFLINKYSVNILSIDDIFLADYLHSLRQLDLRSILNNLLLTVNSHIFLVPKLILAPLALLNIWDTKIPILMGFVFAFLSTLCIISIFVKTLKLLSEAHKVALVIVAYLLTNLIYFSPSASENWMISILSLLELFELLEKISNTKLKWKQLPWRSSDQKVFIADTSKASKALDWVPKISSSEGVAKTLDWANEMLIDQLK